MPDDLHPVLATIASWTDDADLLSSAPGAYALFIRLGEPRPLSGRFAGRTLDPGVYIYAGSAHGPGGIAARCRRHFRRGKARHWHVDALTEAAAELRAAAVPGGDECRLWTRIRRLTGAAAPIPGFGSSDCQTCEAHLLRLKL